MKAIKGSSVVFAVTNYWEKLDMKAEIQQGKNLVDAAKEAGVELFIWSSLLNVAKCEPANPPRSITELRSRLTRRHLVSNGVLPHVYHFDGKAEVEEYARAAGIPATFYLAGFYMSNLPGNMIRQNPPDNNWTFGLPVPETAPIPLVDISDTGKFIKGIVSHREETLGKRILGASAYLTCREILDEFKKAFPEAGKTAGYFNIPHDTFLQILKGQGMPEFAAVEMLENMRLLQEYGYFGGEKLDASHAILEDKLTTWEEFLKKTPVFQELN